MQSSLLYGLIGLVVIWHSSDANKYVTIDAAFSSPDGDNSIYFLAGDQVQVVKGRRGKLVMDRTDLRIPKAMLLQAAFSVPDSKDSPDDRIYYGKNVGIRVSPAFKTPLILKYSQHRAFLRNGGPDAAGSRDGVVLVFKGCQYIVRNDWNSWGTAESLPSVGLPCNVDAAWSKGKSLMVLKGDQMWKWKPNGKVSKPRNVNKAFRFKDDWKVQPSAN